MPISLAMAYWLQPLRCSVAMRARSWAICCGLRLRAAIRLLLVRRFVRIALLRLRVQLLGHIRAGGGQRARVSEQRRRVLEVGRQPTKLAHGHVLSRRAWL